MCRLDDNVTNKQLEVKKHDATQVNQAVRSVFARNCIIRLSFVIQLSRAKPANNQFTGKTLKFRCKLVSESCVESLIRDFAYHEGNSTISFKFSICYDVRTEIPYQISAYSNFRRSSLSILSSWFRMHKLIAAALSPSAKAAKSRSRQFRCFRSCVYAQTIVRRCVTSRLSVCLWKREKIEKTHCARRRDDSILIFVK